MSVSRRRVVLLSLLLAGWTGAVIARLVQIQILRHDHYVIRAAKQQERIVALTPVRGSILDSRGRILAESVAAESIYADPQAVSNVAETAKRLASVREMGLSIAETEKKLRSPGEFVWIARQVNADVARRVKQLRLAGIYSLEEHRRSYPKGALAANLIGYVGIDGEGLGGVEHGWDRYVRGKPGKVTLLRDARRGMYLLGGEGANAAVDGLHVVLTIDEVVQFIAERALLRVVSQYRAAGGSVVVMDPNDGSILAMASLPTFDPNRYREFPSSSWRNSVIHDVYEPGSTFKIVPAAAGLEEQVVTPSQMLDCGDGQIVIANVGIHEHGGARFGMLSFEEVIAKSSNVGIIHVALALGRARFYRHIRRFGFGERTGIDLPGEAMGILRSPERWSQISGAEISIGQEIGVTPLQLVQALSVIANGGLKYDPRIVDRVVDDRGRPVYRVPMSRPERVISERTAAILNEMLKTVVSRGTGKEAALKEHVAAGKTGTAQKAGRGGYLSDKVIASFGGYVPADRPRLAILVVVNEPKGEQYGGVIAAPVFREIAEASLRYLGVAPSIPGRRLRVGEPILAKFSQSEPPAASAQRPRARSRTPNLIGADARAAIARATAEGWEVRTSGSGVVVSQNPAPGVVMEERSVLELKLQSPS